VRDVAGTAACRTRRVQGLIARVQTPLPLRLLEDERVVHRAGQRGMRRVGSHGCVVWRIQIVVSSTHTGQEANAAEESRLAGGSGYTEFPTGTVIGRLLRQHFSGRGAGWKARQTGHLQLELDLDLDLTQTQPIHLGIDFRDVVYYYQRAGSGALGSHLAKHWWLKVVSPHQVCNLHKPPPPDLRAPHLIGGGWSATRSSSISDSASAALTPMQEKAC